MKPKQFNFQKEWSSTVKSLRDQPDVIEGMSKIALHWFELSEFKKDENKEFDKEQAEAEYKLDIMTFSVRHWDQWWLREWTRDCSDITVNLSLGIAKNLFPLKTWEIIAEDEYQIVSDTDRTIVFDFHNFDKFSAGTSLYLAGDLKYKGDDFDIYAAAKFNKEKVDFELRVLSDMKSDIEYADIQAINNVVPFIPGRN